MNERILELEDQCWVKVPCDFDMNAGGLSTIRTVFDRKKFAELIVKECAELSVNSRYANTKSEYYEGFNEALVYVGNKIKQHFGVEE